MTSVQSQNEALDYMHKMTYQKVRAEEKWGAIPMTEANIQAVKAAVTSSEWPYKKVLLTILERWENGYFSRAYEDHNDIWQI